MAELPAPIERLISEFTKLPGIGRKTAQRLAFHLLRAPESDAAAMADALRDLRARTRLCSSCFNVSEGEMCPVCSDPRREKGRVCVVEEAANLCALERTGAFRGVYHVLGGALSPLRDVGPDDLRIRELVSRVSAGTVEEVILALNPDVEGEATSVYLSRLLRPLGVAVTRLAQGLPAGAELEFLDAVTLTRALEGRREY